MAVPSGVLQIKVPLFFIDELRVGAATVRFWRACALVFCVRLHGEHRWVRFRRSEAMRLPALVAILFGSDGTTGFAS